MDLSKSLMILPSPSLRFENEDFSNHVLPEENITMIFEYTLNEQEIGNVITLSLVCKKFYRIATDFPFFRYLKFLHELSQINIRKVELVINPRFLKQLKQCRLRRAPIYRWSKLDQKNHKENGIYNLLRTDYKEAIKAGEDSNRSYLYRLIKYTLQHSRWKCDIISDGPTGARGQLPAKYEENLTKRIPDQEIRNLILGCKKQMLTVCREAGVKEAHMEEVFGSELCACATNKEGKEIHEIILKLLSTNSLVAKVKNCSFDTALQLIQNTSDLESLMTLLSYFSSTSLFNDINNLKSLALQAIRNNPLILEKVCRYIHYFPQQRQYEFKQLFALTALRLDPNIDKTFSHIYEDDLQNDAWILYEKQNHLMDPVCSKSHKT